MCSGGRGRTARAWACWLNGAAVGASAAGGVAGEASVALFVVSNAAVAEPLLVLRGAEGAAWMDGETDDGTPELLVVGAYRRAGDRRDMR